jgi:hypothetical protein
MSAVAVWSGLATVALVIVVRRLSGAFTQPLPLPIFLSVTMVGVLLNLGGNALYRAGGTVFGGHLGDIPVGVATLLPPFAMATAILPGDAPFAGASLATLFIVAGTVVLLLADPGLVEALWKRHTDGESVPLFQDPGLSTGKHTNTTAARTETPVLPGLPTVPIDEVSDSVSLGTAAGDEHRIPNGNIEFWVTRGTNGKGEEYVDGGLFVKFSPHQKRTTMHIPFVPPFNEQPRVVCKVQEEANVRIKVASIHTFGARLEARRTEAIAETGLVEVRFSATAAKRHIEAA